MPPGYRQAFKCSASLCEPVVWESSPRMPPGSFANPHLPFLAQETPASTASGILAVDLVKTLCLSGHKASKVGFLCF